MGLSAYHDQPLSEFIANAKRASPPVPAAAPQPAHTGLPPTPKAIPDTRIFTMSTRKQALLRTAQEASQNYAHSKKQLADAKALNAMGIHAELLFAESREHVCYHAWRRSLEAFIACPN